jgi:hypothetical protein
MKECIYENTNFDVGNGGGQERFVWLMATEGKM